MSEPSPRDCFELWALEDTGDPILAAGLGEAADRIIESHAAFLSQMLGIPVGVLVEQLWAMVEI